MDYIIYGICLYVILIALLSFFNLRLSIALYASYLILVPYLKFQIAGIPLSYNLVNALLFFSFLIQYKFVKKNQLDYTLIAPFLFLYISLFLLTFFAQGIAWSVQFNYWRVSFMAACFVPFILANISLSDTKVLVNVKWALIISIIIACIYGLFLTQLRGMNPYVSFLAQYFGRPDYAGRYSFSDPRLSFLDTDRIQSTMSHPMTWALHLCLLLVVFLVYFFKEKKKWYLGLLSLMVLNLLICGVRTGLGALVVGTSYFLLMNRRFKVFLYGLLIVLVSYFAISSSKDLSNLFISLTDVSGTQSDISGSSIQMRLTQLQGAVDEIKGSEIVGKGYGWTANYLENYGTHPVMLAFESLIVIVLCNSGIIGLCIWLIFLFLLFRLNRQVLVFKEDILLVDTFIVIYVAYLIGTGDSGYMPAFALYYTFLMGSLMRFNEIPRIQR